MIPYKELSKTEKSKNDKYAIRRCLAFCKGTLLIHQTGLSHKKAYQEVLKYLGLGGHAESTINELYYRTKLKELVVKKVVKKPKKVYIKPITDELCFYKTPQWEILRKMTLKKYGIRCMKCKITGVEVHVDHIKPRSLYPELELDFDNLQVLCKHCNLEKGNKDEIDYRNNKIAIPSQYAINQFEKKIKKDKKLKPIKLKTNNP